LRIYWRAVVLDRLFERAAADEDVRPPEHLMRLLLSMFAILWCLHAAGCRAIDDRQVEPGNQASATVNPPSRAAGNRVAFVNSIGMKFVDIPIGDFDMGSPASEAGRSDNETLHHVRISRPLLMAATTVTQSQWQSVMKNNPSQFPGDDRPVDTVSWSDATAFCVRLGAKEGRRYRLPTEAEWEYACRAGTPSPYGGTGNLDEMGWCGDKHNRGTHPVAQKRPNAWGLYDMHGNVWQWCSDGDGRGVYEVKSPRDATFRYLRGGSWSADPRICRAAFRQWNTPDYRNVSIGFRVCLDVEGAVHQAHRAVAFRGESLSLNLGHGVSMKFMLIPAGDFTMGSPETESMHERDETPHEVTLTRPFYMATTHVTVAQWREFVEDSGYRTDAEDHWERTTVWHTQNGKPLQDGSWRNPGFEQRDDHPVVMVSWNDAMRFCRWLSNKSGKSIGLPTEAQYEYASRAGTQTAYFWGDNQNRASVFANCADPAPNDRFPDSKPAVAWRDGFAFTSPVASFKPNAWGLYDMIGNAWEWCADWYHDYPDGPATDPTGLPQGNYRVVRGGSWFNDPKYCRAAFRVGNIPSDSDNYIGFRVCIDSEARSKD